MDNEVQHDVLLPHDFLNETASEAIIIIHGAFIDRTDWDTVIPHLEGYYLLVLDLPMHGEARHIGPLASENAARLLGIPVKQKAKQGHAHVVGLSPGAAVFSICLAETYPQVVTSLVVSGFWMNTNTSLSSAIPSALWLDNRLERLVPTSLNRWLMDGADIKHGDPRTAILECCRQFYDTHTHTKYKWPDPWPARTLIIAAMKRGILPTNDRTDLAIRLENICAERNDTSFAVEHPKMRHPWNRQDPVLFAATARAWVGRRDLPPGFKRLSSVERGPERIARHVGRSTERSTMNRETFSRIIPGK